MKRNIFLAVLLGALIWGLWLQEHRPREVPGVFGFVSWEDLVAIETPGVALKRDGAGWVVSKSGRKVDGEKVRELWSALRTIGTEREITDQNILRSEAFPASSERLILRDGKGGRMEMVLGNKLRFDRSFYLETVEMRDGRQSIRRWVARDHALEPGVYNVKTVHRSAAKYQRLKLLLQLTEDAFYPSEDQS